MRGLMTAIPLCLLAACAAHRPPPATTLAAEAETQTPPTWETLILPEDATRLDDIARRWVNARSAARRVSAKRLDTEGDLLEAGGALAYPDPSPGPYRCRRVRIGTSPRSFVSEAPGFCAVQATDRGLGFVMQTGAARPDGYLFADKAMRMVLLGGEAPGKSGRAPGYGSDAGHSVTGSLERIGDFRWRLILPRRDEGLDVIEMVPIAPKMRGDQGAIQASDAG
jgi:Domain of unknown function (DUF4893)